MSFVFYYKPDFKAPYRSDGVEESCVLAYNYFSTLVDYFVEKLPEHRLPLESDDEEPTLADRIHLIFPNGFGEPDIEKNRNPDIWPWLVALSDYLRDGNIMKYAKVLCQFWKVRIKMENSIMDQVQLLQTIFDFFTAYLQLFVTLVDANSINLDFKYPPEDEAGVLIGSIFRKSDYRIEGPWCT